jgi:tetratricopeptide (TPR) repeat protein
MFSHLFKNRNVSESHVFLSFLLFVILGVCASLYLSRALIIEATWQDLHSPRLALFLTDDARFAFKMGDYYFNVRGSGVYDLDLARAAYEKANHINPRLPLAHYELARVYFVLGNPLQATEEINRELLVNPSNLRALYIRGLIEGTAGDLVSAANDFRAFTKWARTEWAGYNDLAWVLEKNGDYAGAKEATLLGLKNAHGAENNPWLWNSLGVAELNLGEKTNASNDFKKALELSRVLTLRDWQRSYPGNDPASAAGGLQNFQDAIEKNLRYASEPI